MFYSSYSYLHDRLAERFACEVVPGVTSVSASTAALAMPVARHEDVLTVLPGTLPEDELVRHMAGADALAVLKTGRNLPRVRRALERAGRLDQAWLVERGTMPGQRVARLAQVDTADCPYFAMVLVHGQGRRPEAPE